jgi:hypothetical protein
MPFLPKDSEEVNTHAKHLHAMLDAATMTDPTLHKEVRGEVRTSTIARAHVKTRPVAYHSP